MQANSHTSVAFSPMVEFGGKIAIGDMILRPFQAGGVRLLPDKKRWTDASLFGALPAAGTFCTYSELRAVVTSVAAGLQLYGPSGPHRIALLGRSMRSWSAF